ncbi:MULTISPECIES: transposase [unclassified Streptomyces]|uniref:IS110 family transposase n=1 Tax=unclassified Streptomyces TaxID=2593676 RepID=UPI003660CF84
MTPTPTSTSPPSSTPSGRHLATEAFPTTLAGYRSLLEWLHSHGQVQAVGMEGTGSFGDELSRYLRANQIVVIEVDRPDRRARRAARKSDPIDAYAAATAILASRATGTPKHRNGAVEAIRGLRVVRASAVKARAQTVNQIKSLIITAPAAVREALRSLTTTELVRRLAASRPGTDLAAPATAVKVALKRLARRYRYLSKEKADADVELRALITLFGLVTCLRLLKACKARFVPQDALPGARAVIHASDGGEGEHASCVHWPPTEVVRPYRRDSRCGHGT